MPRGNTLRISDWLFCESAPDSAGRFTVKPAGRNSHSLTGCLSEALGDLEFRLSAEPLLFVNVTKLDFCFLPMSRTASANEFGDIGLGGEGFLVFNSRARSPNALI